MNGGDYFFGLVFYFKKKKFKKTTITFLDSQHILIKGISSDRDLRLFLKKNSLFLKKMQMKLDTYPNLGGIKQGEEGDIYWFLGDPYTLVSSKGLQRIRLNKEDKTLLYPCFNCDAEKIFKLMEYFFLKKAKLYIQDRVELLLKKYPLLPRPTFVGVKYLKSSWGLCSSKGYISLNWKLIQAPWDVIDYVIIHECCHLKYMNHSKKFWEFVASYCKNYRELKQWLTQNQFSLRFIFKSVENQLGFITR